MAKSATQDRGQRPGTSFDAIPGLDPASFAANLEPFFQAGTKALDAWRVVSEELLEFGKARLTRNMEMSRKVCECGSLDKALEAQADFARTMMQDYIAETGKLAELGTRAVTEGFSFWKNEAVKTPAARAAHRVEAEAEETTKHPLAAE
ncbi:MAG TPA: phasin family protein [Stellaceae bacterium]|nr:phasin family protein [Stellaceae bacterium]